MIYLEFLDTIKVKTFANFKSQFMSLLLNTLFMSYDSQERAYKINKKATSFLKTTLASKDDKKTAQLFPDPSVVPEVITAEQIQPGLLNIILNVTTTWCYALNRTRIKLLGIQYPHSYKYCVHNQFKHYDRWFWFNKV